jgi:leucyl-tRNA synthetase
MSEPRKRVSRNYSASKIEPKWQKKWAKNPQTASQSDSLPKKYILIEFPYPSGDGLHVGHVRPYCAMDAVARQQRLAGNNVLFPIGWDAFGLPAENYAIKTGQHPRIATNKNIANYRRQMKMLGLSFDWSREVDTSDPIYYKWTQWIFLQFYKKGLAYQATMPINWCPSCKIGLANEEVVNGKCERCGTLVTRKRQTQWMLKITAYADRLLNDLETVDYLPKIKTQQVNWIGKSEGAEIEFNIQDSKSKIKVFTTRPDTIFGATYLVVAPEHEIVQNTKFEVQNNQAIADYLKQAATKSDLDRTDLAKDKTGVELKGIMAINPINHEVIPIWVADYVLETYGTGAIMAVPAHDKRDYEFALKYELPIRQVIITPDSLVKKDEEISVFVGEGELINSGKYNGMSSSEAATAIVKDLAESGAGKLAVQYKLRDWVFSRQHYWGEPIPIVHCEQCGIVAVPEKDLPVELPHVEKYQPTDTGESPLANITEWVNTSCPRCGGPAKRETDTMPSWAGSSWYYLRYCDPRNKQAIADLAKLSYWLPVDIYNGGMEHTVLHLLYSRFWHKFLFDQGLVPHIEPYQHRHSHGMVLAEDSQKMSKSRGNVINPDDVVEQYGADTLRIYEMFMGPFEDAIPWSTKGMVGAYRFLNNVWSLFQREYQSATEGQRTEDLRRITHKTIQKVTHDLATYKFNTAVSAMMELSNFLRGLGDHEVDQSSWDDALRAFLVLLFPFAPHITSELWEEIMGGDIQKQSWPKYDEKHLKDEIFELIIQINGKVRGKIPNVATGIDETGVVAAVMADEKLVDKVIGYKKVVYVPNRLINFIV